MDYTKDAILDLQKKLDLQLKLAEARENDLISHIKNLTGKDLQPSLMIK